MPVTIRFQVTKRHGETHDSGSEVISYFPPLSCVLTDPDLYTPVTDQMIPVIAHATTSFRVTQRYKEIPADERITTKEET